MGVGLILVEFVLGGKKIISTQYRIQILGTGVGFQIICMFVCGSVIIFDILTNNIALNIKVGNK
jgi:hypothetical protein